MKILAVSTSSNVCSVAILENSNLVKELNIKNTKTHSENLLPLIDEILKLTNIDISEIELVACDNGPGSFTGIRIGIATIKGIAEANNIPVISCTSLEALSFNVEGISPYICSIIDARNNQVYAGLFDNEHNLLHDYFADDFENVLKSLDTYSNISFVGSGAILNKSLLRNVVLDNDVHAKNVGLCAYKKYENGIIGTADSVVPLYLRKSQAERMKNINDN